MSRPNIDDDLTPLQILEEFLWVLDELLAIRQRKEIDHKTFVQRKETLVKWCFERLKYKQDAKVGKQLVNTAARRRRARRNNLLGSS